jgi:hypothetical protein
VQVCAADGQSWGNCGCRCNAGFEENQAGACVASTPVCTAGAEKACAGCTAANASGVQVCAADGKSWGNCGCRCYPGYRENQAGACVFGSSCPSGQHSTGAGCASAAMGNITFLWSFAGASCAQTPSVASVQVQIVGANGAEQLANGGSFPCNTSGSDGIQLLGFAGGDYAYTLTGISAAYASIFQARGTLVVDGNVAMAVDLKPR